MTSNTGRSGRRIPAATNGVRLGTRGERDAGERCEAPAVPPALPPLRALGPVVLDDDRDVGECRGEGADRPGTHQAFYMNQLGGRPETRSKRRWGRRCSDPPLGQPEERVTRFADQQAGDAFNLDFGVLPGRLHHGDPGAGALRRRGGATEIAPRVDAGRVPTAGDSVQVQSHDCDSGSRPIGASHGRKGHTTSLSRQLGARASRHRNTNGGVKSLRRAIIVPPVISVGHPERPTVALGCLLLRDRAYAPHFDAQSPLRDVVRRSP